MPVMIGLLGPALVAVVLTWGSDTRAQGERLARVEAQVESLQREVLSGLGRLELQIKEIGQRCGVPAP